MIRMLQNEIFIIVNLFGLDLFLVYKYLYISV